MLPAKPDDQPALGGHPRIALDISVELFPSAVLPALVLDENPPLLVAQVGVGDDPAVLIRDLQLRSCRRKIVTAQPVPHDALGCGLGACVEPAQTVASPNYATSTSSRDDPLRETIGNGQAQSEDGVSDGHQLRRGEELSQIDIEASPSRDPDSVNFVDVLGKQRSTMHDQFLALWEHGSRRQDHVDRWTITAW